MNLKKYSVLFSVIGIASLYLLSCFCRPSYIDISRASDFEGKKVITKGRVKEISENKFQNQIITIQDNNSSIKIFSEELTKVEYGDIIEVTGDVQKYGEIWEIVVESSEDIKILKKWENISMPLWQITMNPDRYLGTNVKVRGHIENIYNSFFYLKDINTEHKIIISYEGIKFLYLKPGKEVIVKGVLSYDDTNFRYLIKICDSNHEILMKG